MKRKKDELVRKSLKGLEEYQEIFWFGIKRKYARRCEVCLNDQRDLIKLPGGHFTCNECKKKLKLLKKNTIIKKGKGFIKFNKTEFYLPQSWEKMHPSDPIKKSRKKLWEKIIICDYEIAMFNKHFKYEY